MKPTVDLRKDSGVPLKTLRDFRGFLKAAGSSADFDSIAECTGLKTLRAE